MDLAKARQQRRVQCLASSLSEKRSIQVVEHARAQETLMVMLFVDVSHLHNVC